MQATLDGEALLAKSALALAHALASTDRETAPYARVNLIGVLIAIAGLGALCPRTHGNNLITELTALGAEKCLGFILRHCASEFLQAHVVVATLEHGEGDRARHDGLEGLGQTG